MYKTINDVCASACSEILFEAALTVVDLAHYLQQSSGISMVEYSDGCVRLTCHGLAPTIVHLLYHNLDKLRGPELSVIFDSSSNLITVFGECENFTLLRRLITVGLAAIDGEHREDLQRLWVEMSTSRDSIPTDDGRSQMRYFLVLLMLKTRITK